jgi:hypothetical protein
MRRRRTIIQGNAQRRERERDSLRKIKCSVDEIARSMEIDRLKFVVLERTDHVVQLVRTEKTKFRERTKCIAEFHRSIVVFAHSSHTRVDRLEDQRVEHLRSMFDLILLFHTRDVPRRSRGRMCKHTNQCQRFARNTDLKRTRRSLFEKIDETHFSTNWNRVVEFVIVSHR